MKYYSFNLHNNTNKNNDSIRNSRIIRKQYV